MKINLLAFLIVDIFLNILIGNTSIFISSQMHDYCSNEEYLHHNIEECIKIQGCCFAKITTKPELNEEYIVDNHRIEINSCFKKYKLDTKNTCDDYKIITSEFGNEVIECKCNDLI